MRLIFCLQEMPDAIAGSYTHAIRASGSQRRIEVVSFRHVLAAMTPSHQLCEQQMLAPQIQSWRDPTLAIFADSAGALQCTLSIGFREFMHRDFVGNCAHAKMPNCEVELLTKPRCSHAGTEIYQILKNRNATNNEKSIQCFHLSLNEKTHQTQIQ